jgi:hypothetical protein
MEILPSFLSSRMILRSISPILADIISIKRNISLFNFL